MKTTVALVLLVLMVVVIAWGGVQAFQLVRQWWLKRHANWELTERSDGEQVCIYAERVGDEQLLIGAVPFAAQDFDSQLYELRAEGRGRVYALNQREKA